MEPRGRETVELWVRRTAAAVDVLQVSVDGTTNADRKGVRCPNTHHSETCGSCQCRLNELAAGRSVRSTMDVACHCRDGGRRQSTVSCNETAKVLRGAVTISRLPAYCLDLSHPEPLKTSEAHGLCAKVSPLMTWIFLTDLRVGQLQRPLPLPSIIYTQPQVPPHA